MFSNHASPLAKQQLSPASDTTSRPWSHHLWSQSETHLPPLHGNLHKDCPDPRGQGARPVVRFTRRWGGWANSEGGEGGGRGGSGAGGDLSDESPVINQRGPRSWCQGETLHDVLPPHPSYRRVVANGIPSGVWSEWPGGWVNFTACCRTFCGMAFMPEWLDDRFAASASLDRVVFDMPPYLICHIQTNGVFMIVFIPQAESASCWRKKDAVVTSLPPLPLGRSFGK